MGCVASCAGDDGDVTQFYTEAQLTHNLCVLNKKAVVTRRHGDVTRVNNFKVGKSLGEGRYGEVYLCHSRRPGAGRGWCCGVQKQQFAVKIVRRSQAPGAEFKVLRRVQHKHVVRLVECIDDKSQPELFLVFEVLGRPIAQCGHTGRLVGAAWPEGKARPLFLQIVSALSHLHEQGIVHRDVKPDNVVYADASERAVKLIDFGESRILKQGGLGDDASRDTRGTPFFQAAEALTGYYYPDKAGDVWALGVLFYLLLVGHVPFGVGCTTKPQLYNAISEGVLTFPPHLPAHASGLLACLLDRDLSRRITLPAAALHPWFDRGEVDFSPNSLVPEAHPPPPTGAVDMGAAAVAQPGYAAAKKRPRRLDNLCVSDAPPADAGPPPARNPLCSPGLDLLKGRSYENASCRSMLPNAAGPAASEKRHVPDPVSPQLPAEAVEASSPLGRLLGAQLPTVKVLVVDHVYNHRLIVCKMLASAAMMPDGNPIPIYEQCTGADALESILERSRARDRYDLVLLDLFLPDVNGLAVAALVREAEAKENLDRTPIAIATTEECCTATVRQQAEELTAAMLIKPFNISQIIRILNWLGVRHRHNLINDHFARDRHIADSHYLDNSKARAKVGRFRYTRPTDAVVNLSPANSVSSRSVVTHDNASRASSGRISPQPSRVWSRKSSFARRSLEAHQFAGELLRTLESDECVSRPQSAPGSHAGDSLADPGDERPSLAPRLSHDDAASFNDQLSLMLSPTESDKTQHSPAVLPLPKIEEG
eukprot:TRINITY_DN9435_c0_g1_i3.p1 TRINITY_DN9435_c0_g1~~TRINITY_DN9435_c0_g1_i3.p1  ORF type:complete len:765 (+),score=248.29 TRINITY_DN9435_c0_g1_i3:149-2443(+)